MRQLRRDGPAAGAVVDAAGGAVLVGLLGVVIASARQPGDVIPTVGLLLVLGSTYAAARFLTTLHDWLVPALVVASAAALAVVRADVLLGGPLDSPLGYANATGAFYMVTVGAALMVATRVDSSPLRTVAIVAAVGAFLVPMGSRAQAAAALSLVLPVALAARPLGMRVRTVVLAAGAVAVLGVGVTAVVGATYSGEGQVARLVAEALSERRPVLWADAVDQVRQAPATGVGLGRFDEVSPTALSDRDAAWAHHEYLELTAETGLLGGVLAALALLYLFARLWVGPRDPATGVAACTVAALSLAACIDYVLHFPAVVAAGAAVAGAGLRLSPGGR